MSITYFRIIVLLLLPLYCTMLKSEAASTASGLQIVGTNGVHACPGRNLTLQCTVNGVKSDTAVWEGTAFSGCEISLTHNRFATGTSRACSNGAITGQSIRIERNSTYISQLEVIVAPEMIGKNIVCNRDSGTVYAIGCHQLNIASSRPAIIDTQLTVDKTNLQLSFSWIPAISDCPTTYYYILSANCGNCPFATTDTSVTCYDVPFCGLCVVAVQAIISDYTVKGLLSDPVYVSLNQTKNCVLISYNNSEINTGSDVNNVSNIKIDFTVFVAAIVSTAVLATALTLCFTVTIAALLVKKRVRSSKLLQQTNGERLQVEKRLYEPVAHHLTSVRVTLENEAYGTNSSVNICKQ